jgi:hypothetical protein
VLDQIVVVGASDCFEDDVVITLNGQSLMSLSSFHEIDFEGACDRTCQDLVDPIDWTPRHPLE